jgi:hypothetical protein
MVFSGTMSRRSLPGLLLALAACVGGPPTAATSEPAPQSNATDALAPSETATISTELASRVDDGDAVLARCCDVGRPAVLGERDLVRVSSHVELSHQLEVVGR